MSYKTRLRQLLLLMLCFGATLHAQEKHRIVKPPSAPILAFEIKLLPDPTRSISYEDNFPAIPKGCDSNGNPFIDVLGENGSQIIGFGPKGTVLFGTDKITDIPEPRIGQIFVAESRVYILVTGLLNSKKQENSFKNENGQEVKYTTTKGEPAQYIARFDLDGTYRGALKLEFDFTPMQVAAFLSGEFLVAGLDGEKVPRVALLNSSGQFLQYLELPKDISSQPQLKNEQSFLKQSHLPTSAEILAIFANFYPYEDQILFVRSGNTTPIYKISESGEIKSLRAKLPAGWTVDRMISSSEKLFMEVNDGDLSSTARRTIFELDSASGQPLAEYRIGIKDSLKESVACVDRETFVGIRHSDGRVTLVSGTAQTTNPTAAGPIR